MLRFDPTSPRSDAPDASPPAQTAHPRGTKRPGDPALVNDRVCREPPARRLALPSRRLLPASAAEVVVRGPEPVALSRPAAFTDDASLVDAYGRCGPLRSQAVKGHLKSARAYMDARRGPLAREPSLLELLKRTLATGRPARWQPDVQSLAQGEAKGIALAPLIDGIVAAMAPKDPATEHLLAAYRTDQADGLHRRHADALEAYVLWQRTRPEAPRAPTLCDLCALLLAYPLLEPGALQAVRDFIDTEPRTIVRQTLEVALRTLVAWLAGLPIDRSALWPAVPDVLPATVPGTPGLEVLERIHDYGAQRADVPRLHVPALMRYTRWQVDAPAVTQTEDVVALARMLKADPALKPWTIGAVVRFKAAPVDKVHKSAIDASLVQFAAFEPLDDALFASVGEPALSGRST